MTATLTTENADHPPTRPIRILLLSNAIEHLAYRFTQIALPLVVLREVDSAAMAGLVGGRLAPRWRPLGSGCKE